MGKHFGTDGIRGQAGVPPLDRDTVVAFGRAVAERLIALGGAGKPMLVVRDTRESGPRILEWLCAAAQDAGVSVVDAGVLPTAAAALLNHGQFAGAVVISASHNPWQDNGLKAMGPGGAKLSDADEHWIEARMDEIQTQDPPSPCRTADWAGARDAYADAVLERAGRPDLHGMRILLDSAHGAASGMAARVFSLAGAVAEDRAAAPDGRNINERCGAVHPEALAAGVHAAGAALGFAFDGDADRCIGVARDGRILDGDVLLWHLARWSARSGRAVAGVCGTLMTNGWLPALLEKEGIGFHRAAVGDRHVHAALMARGWTLGGEASGHVLMLDRSPTGDGLLTALCAAQALRETGALDDPLAGVQPFPQRLKNVPVSRKVPLESAPRVLERVAEAERALTRGRVVVRYSGTESKLRIMVEGERADEVDAWTDRLCRELPSFLEEVPA